jgi:short-subunit dehydrogenase
LFPKRNKKEIQEKGERRVLPMCGEKKRVLVTGVSRGIGKAIARTLVEHGYEVYGTSRHPENIPQEKRVAGVHYFPLDLADYKSIDRLVDNIGPVDVLVNNAGASQIGPLEEAPVSLVLSIFQTNLFAVMYLTNKIIPLMREKKRGQIINISSLADMFVVPFSTIYAASKHGLRGYSKGLRHELKCFGILVTIICPYGIRSDKQPQILINEGSLYKKVLDRVLLLRSRRNARAPSAEVVARKVLKILRKKAPRFSYPVGGIAPLLAFLVKIFPQKPGEKIERLLFRLDHSSTKK